MSEEKVVDVEVDDIDENAKVVGLKTEWKTITKILKSHKVWLTLLSLAVAFLSLLMIWCVKYIKLLLSLAATLPK